MLIVGGGFAGLTAGCYAQMNGFQTKVLEMNPNAGGMCTAWKRGGYVFDDCVHWLVGTNQEAPLNRVWRELGLVQGKKFHKEEVFQEARLADGQKLTVYTDMDKLRAELLRLAPGDQDVIDGIIKDMKALGQMDAPLDIGLGNMFSALRFARMLNKYSMTGKELAQRFKDPTMRELFDLAFSWDEQIVAFTMMSAASIGAGHSAYPLGGSLPLTEALERRYRSLGGDIQFKAKVSKILVENDRAVGVRLEDGSEQQADIVFSAIDGHRTIFGMLQGKYVSQELKGFYDTFRLFPPLVALWLGVKGNIDIPSQMKIKLKTPIQEGDHKVEWMYLGHCAYDSSMAPPGCTVVRIGYDADYDHWQSLAKDKEAYLKEKSRVQGLLLQAADLIVPGLASRVEVSDLATPLTFVRYSGNYRGSYQGWEWTKESSLKDMPKTLSGLQGFYMAGHWTAPGGGLPGAAMTARAAIKKLCKAEGMKFTAQEPK